MALTDEQKAELKRIFDSFDADGDGHITADELRKAFDRMGQHQICDLQIAEMIGQADTDGSGTIDFDEYVAQKIVINVEHMKKLFEKYDVNGDGYLGLDEVVAMAQELGYKRIKKRLAKKFIKSVDTDGDGKLTFEEFKLLNIREMKV